MNPDKDSLWWHYQVIIVPKQFSDDLGSKGYMQIEAGSNNGNPPNIQSNEDIDMAKVSLLFCFQLIVLLIDYFS